MSQTASLQDTKKSRLLPGYMVLVFGITLVGIGISITRPYLALFGTNVISMTPAELGIFMCVNALGGIFASTWLGRMSDMRTPKKDIMLLSAICAGLGYSSFLIFHNYYVLLIVSTVLLGFGAAVFPQMFAYARETAVASKTADATFAISTLRSFFSLAWVIGPLMGAWILQAYHYNGLFVATAVIFFIVFVIVLLRLQRRSSAGITGSQPVKVLSYLKRPEILMTSLSFVAVNTAASINGLYMPLFVTTTLHAPQYVVGWVVSLSAALEIPLIFGLTAVSNRYGKRPMMLFGSLCGTAYYVGAAFATAVWEMLALQLLCAIFIAISVSIGMSYFQDFVPEAPGSVTTLYSNTFNIGSLVGSLLGGVIAQVLNYRDVYLFCVALGIVSYVLLLRRRPKVTGTQESGESSRVYQ